MNQRILVADDEKEIRDLVKIYLQAEGFSIDTVADVEEALQSIKEKDYDLVILDIMMPKMDGITTLINIRKEHTMPIIFLTAKCNEIDMVQGLTLGADDYIEKPFSSMTLIARVKAQLRRSTIFNNVPKTVIRIGELELNTEMHRVTVSGKEINLTPTEYKILELLAKNRNIVFSVDKIYESI